jgi:4'-phosphopantetheinyl transferase
MRIAANDALVWKVGLDVDKRCFELLRQLLTLDERQRADEFQLDMPRRRFVIARAALRVLLGRFLDAPPAAVELRVDEFGKPMIEANRNDLGLRFNVAHSDELALIAITLNREVGVDVERLRSVGQAAQIAERYFHSTEIQSILGAPANDRDAVFLGCWTAKEAALKAIGTGITGSLAEFYVSFDSDGSAVIDVPTNSPNGKSTHCYVQRLDAGRNYSAAIAFVGSLPKVQVCEMDW